MKIAVIHGANHKGSTYHITQQLLENLDSNTHHISEFFLPRDMDQFCIGCTNCFMKGENLCPHYHKLLPIKEALEQSELLIFDSPVYVLHTTGQMKVLLDHFGYRFLVHRPHPSMFQKTAVIITTAAGGGMKSTIKDIKDSLTFWGVGRIHTYGIAVNAIDWQGVPQKKKDAIQNHVKKLASKIKKNYQKVKPSLKVKGLFYIMRFSQKKFRINEVDYTYWKEMGWLDKKRPW